MAKQNQPKDQKTAQEVSNPVQPATDAFGDTNNVEQPIQNLDNHNPYSQQNLSENVTGTGSTNSIEPDASQDNSVITPAILENNDPNIIQPTVQQPVKPVLTDQVVFEDFSEGSSFSVKNSNGVIVNLSGTAAKILKNLDATTKIVNNG